MIPKESQDLRMRVQHAGFAMLTPKLIFVAGPASREADDDAGDGDDENGEEDEWTGLRFRGLGVEGSGFGV